MADPQAATVTIWKLLPSAWARHAERLRRSAELLWEPLQQALVSNDPPSDPRRLALWDHSYAFLLVAGASLEAMFKAAAIQAKLVAGGLEAVMTPNGTLHPWLLTHDLVALAKVADVSLSANERSRLERFTKYVVWAGSYPTQKDLKDPRPDAILVLDFDVSDGDRVWFDTLYGRAEQALKERLEKMQEMAVKPADAR